MAKVRGEYGWLTLAGYILVYDILAIKTDRLETLSTAIWRSLEHPMKYPVVTISWCVLTHHLFLNDKARMSLKKAWTSIANKDEQE